MSKYPDGVAASTAKECVRTGKLHTQAWPAVPGADLCGPCRNHLTQVLRELVRILATLDASVVRQPTKDYARDRVAGGSPKDVTATWNVDVTDARTRLVDWALYVGRTLARDFPGNPGVDETTDPKVILATAARWHARWLASYPGLGPAFLDDALDLVDTAKRALNSTPVRRVRLDDWICDAIVEDTPLGPVECGATMVAIIRPDDSTDGIDTARIVCTAHPHEHPKYVASEWIHATT